LGLSQPPGQSQPSRLPQGPARPGAEGISAATLASRIDDFLAARGVRPGQADRASQPAAEVSARPDTSVALPADFVCEEDVRAAVRQQRKILVGDRTIITPAARDLGEAERVFEQDGWRP
jgi:hypothetical protein